MARILIKDIYRLRQQEYTYQEIADELNCHITTINNKINSIEYTKYEENAKNNRELLHKSDPKKRTRRMVNELLEAVESGLMESKTGKEKLRYIDDVKRLVDIVGIGEDENAELNVVAVPSFMEDDEEFNRMVSGTLNSNHKNVSVSDSTTGVSPTLEAQAENTEVFPGGEVPNNRDCDSNSCTGASTDVGSTPTDPHEDIANPKGIKTHTYPWYTENGKDNLIDGVEITDDLWEKIEGEFDA